MATFGWHPAVLLSAPARKGTGSGRVLEFGWDGVDHAPALLLFAVLGVGGALLLGVLGLPPVDLHGPLHRIFGIMDPFCGGTRAVYWMARGRLDEAWRYNPGSFVLALFVAAVYGRDFYGRLRGRWLTVRVRGSLLLIVAGLGLTALQVNQQLNAALLMRP